MISTLRLRQSIPLLVLFVVLGYSVFYAVAFVQIYRHPHSYEAASQWIFDNVPPGSKILGPHWDDRLPLTLPDLDAHRFDFESPTSELGLYEPDTPRNLTILFERIAAGDYIVFPTPRLQGSVPRIPEEYPHTTAFFQLLWAEKLGFHLVKVVKERPNLWGVSFNDDLADESISVYDHPKVTIFKNVERLSAQEMHRRVLSPSVYAPLPTLKDILLADSAAAISEAVDQSSKGWMDLIKSVLAVEVLAWSSLVLLIPLSRGLPARLAASLAASKFLGLVAFTLLVCVFSLVTKTPLSGSFARGAAVVFVLVALVVEVRRRFSGVAILFQSKGLRRHVQIIEGLFLGTTTLFFFAFVFLSESQAGIAFDPSLLAFFNRNETFPPQDPMLIGQHLPLSLYIRSCLPLVFGLLSKAVGIVPGVEYPVAVAITAGAVASVLYSTLVFALRKQAAAFILVFVLVIGSALVWSRFDRSHWTREPSLSGNLSAERLAESKVASWFAQSIKGTPTVFDASKLSTSPVSSIALRGGVPVFLARDISTFYTNGNDEILRRRSAVQEVYGSTDAEAAFKILQSYGIDLVLVGPTERSLFSRDALSKFEHHEDYFAELFNAGEWRVFATAFSPYFVVPGAGTFGEGRR